MKTKLFIFTLFVVIAVCLFILIQINPKQKALKENQIVATVNEPNCENFQDIQIFATPTPIVWFAKLDDCVLSCEGGSFTKITSNSQEKYPRFVGYMKDGIIPEKYLEDDIRLKITGEWESIGDDYSRTEFNNKCVPIVNILKIE